MNEILVNYWTTEKFIQIISETEHFRYKLINGDLACSCTIKEHLYRPAKDKEILEWKLTQK